MRQHHSKDQSQLSLGMDGAKIMAVIQAIEALYPHDNWIRTATRIRKSEYNGFYWMLLMPGSIRVAVPNEGQGLSPEISEILNGPQQLVFKDPLGNDVDLCHACAVIEALSNPVLNFIFRLSGMSRPAVVSWSGDIGSVITQYSNPKRTDEKNLAALFKIFANSADLFGDIDGYAIFKTVPSNSRLLLSEILDLYYHRDLPQRFTLFRQQAGFQSVEFHGAQILTEGSVEKVKKQIERFAFWNTLLRHFLLQIIHYLRKRPYSQHELDQVSDGFIDWMTIESNRQSER